MEKTVVELFAGVGGFRVGLNEVTLNTDGKAIEKNNFRFVWINQWEPSTKKQDAFECYESRFGKNELHTNEDICIIDKNSIPNHNLLVGGFPCQDYSVARSLSNEKGIEGKKGVLWWQINEVLTIKRPPFVLLENVDRLIKSPSTQRGRDFGIMLKCFNNLGYGVEWRIINAAEYGFPQKRRRIYIFAFHNTTNYYKNLIQNSVENIINENGIFVKAFPITKNENNISSISLSTDIYCDLLSMTQHFKFKFENSGLLLNDTIYTVNTNSTENTIFKLKDLLQTENIPSFCFLNGTEEKFKYLKGSKRILRQKNGNSYFYSEGSMAFPDNLELPGRTMLTSEGTVNRSTHVINDPISNRLRILTPIEAERLNQFPDDWTNTGMTNKKRYFMMGNALVCGIIKKIGSQISTIMNDEV